MPDDLEKIRKEIARDRKRYDKMREGHIEARNRSRMYGRLFQRQSIIDQNVGSGSSSLKILKAALISSIYRHPTLRKYRNDRRVHVSLIFPKWKRHLTDRSFATAYVNTYGLNVSVPPKVSNLGGFYDREAKTIHLRSKSKIGHFLHEVIHSLGDPTFNTSFGVSLNEGVTQYFTDVVLKMSGAQPFSDHMYKSELACATNLIAVMGIDKVAYAYFKDTGVPPLMRELAQKMKLTLARFTAERARGRLCRRLQPMAQLARLPALVRWRP